MSDPDPTIREDGAAPAPPPATPPPPPAAAPPPAAPSPTPAPAMAGAAAASPTAAGSGAAASPAMARWNALGANGRLMIVGAALALGSYLLGWLIARWDLASLAHILVILAAIAAIGVVILATGAIPAVARAIVLRLAAGVVLAYAAIDVGDMVGSLSTWSALDILFTVTTAIGGAIMLVSAWRLTDGDVAGSAGALARIGGRPSPNQLILLGGVAVIAAWFLIVADDFRFRDQDVISVLLVVVAMLTVWVAAGGAGTVRWPLPAPIVLVGLAAVVALLALNWISRVLDELDAFSIVGWAGLILHVGGAALLLAGAALAWQAGRTGTATMGAPPAAAPPAA